MSVIHRLVIDDLRFLSAHKLVEGLGLNERVFLQQLPETHKSQ